MIKLSGAFWRLDWMLAQLARWNATGVALHENEVGGHIKVEKRGKAWKSFKDATVTEEQVRAIEKKSCFRYTYQTATSKLHLYIIAPANLENTELAEQIQKEMTTNDRLHHKR